MPAMHSGATQPGCGAQQLLRPCAFGGRKPFHAGTAREPVAACKRHFSSTTFQKAFYSGIYVVRPASPGSSHFRQQRDRRGALKCAASSGSTVRLTTQHEVAFGEVIKVVGMQEELGAWDPVAAPGLTWSDGNKWSVDLQLPPGSYEFKLVVVREDGTAAVWEEGPNREIVVEEAKDDVIEAECSWSNTTATLVTNAPRSIPLESETDEAVDIVDKAETPAETSGAVAQVEAAEAEAESSGMTLSEAEPQPPATDSPPANQASDAPEGSEAIMPGDAEKPVGEAQQDDAENALEAVTEPEGELEEPKPSLDLEAPTVPGGADEWGPAGGGEMGSVDEADVEKQERSEVQERWADNIVQAETASDGPAEPEAADSDATPQQPTAAAPLPDSASASAAEEGEGTGGVLKLEAEGSSVAEAAGSPTAAAQFQPDPTPEQIASGTLEVAAEGTKVADAAGGPVAQAVFKTDASPEGKESGGPPVGLQVFVGTLALFAVPVVAWSLYTLNTTGCGLPPGPGGALGALEGVSYVTLLGVVAWSIGMKATTSKGLPPGPGGLLGAAEGLSYLSLAAGAVVLVLQVKNYGYVPSALPDAKCFGDSGPKSPSDITKALADAFASASPDAPPLTNRLQDARTSGRPAASSVADAAASSSGAAASEAGAQGTPVLLGWMRPMSPRSLQNLARLPTRTLAMLPAAAAADAERPVAPGNAAAGQAVQAAKRKINTALVSQQDRLEEVYAGALDGLSGADIESAVDELENVFSRIARVLGDALPSLGELFSGLFSGADRSQQPPQQEAAVVSGWLSGAVDPLRSAAAAGSTGPAAVEEQAGLSMASPSTGLGSALPLTVEDNRGHTVFLDLQQKDFVRSTEQLQEGAGVGGWTGAPQNRQAGLVQVAFDLSDLAVPADIGFTAAATNAVSAAVNVNSQLTQQVIAPLRTAADDVRRIADEIARLGAAVDGEAAAGRPEALTQSTEALQTALGSAEKTVSGANSGLLALVKQLEDAVAALNKACCPPEGVKEEKVSAVLQKLEAATADLRKAAESGEVTSSLQSAQAQVEALDTVPGAGAKAASETEPALKSIEKAVDGLHSVLTELEAAVGAAKDISLPSAPPLRN